MKIDEARVYLWVQEYGNDASLVTDLIGIEPTYIKVKGETNPQFPRMVSQVTSWQLHSPLPLEADIDEHLEALLGMLQPHTDKVKEASEIFKVGINAVVYYHVDWQPGIHLTERSIQLMAKMNVSLDYDLYFLGSFDGEAKASFNT